MVSSSTWALWDAKWNFDMPGIGRVGTDNLSKDGFWHDLFYGNPHRRKWHCQGDCPEAVEKLAAEEDAKHRAALEASKR